MQASLPSATKWGILLAVACFPLPAQETRGMIFGRVLDQQDAVVVNAAVTVTSVETNTTLSTRSNETGYYAVNLLLPGNYRVSAEAAGFKKLVRSGIVLPVSTQVQVDFRLEVGAVTETVSVTAEAPLLDTNAVSSGRIMDNRSLMSLPQFSNRTLDMVRLTPGLQIGAAGYRFQNMTQTSEASYGTLPGSLGGHEYSIDGIPNLGGGRRAGEQPFTDVLQEFKVETSSFDASMGHSVGANVAMLTKSGTNALHGTATWQHWQQRWNGAGFFVNQLYYRQIAEAEARGDAAQAAKLRSQDKQPSGHANNYGATIGGPVYLPKIYDGRNRLFFFFSVNGFRDAKKAYADYWNRTIPTLANRAGDFSDLLRVDAVRYQIYDPLTVRRDPARPTHYIRDPFAGNIIPASRRVNPAYAAYDKLLPTPNNNPLDPGREPLNNYLAVAMPFNFRYKAFTNRIDYHHSTAHRFFGRWGWAQPIEDRIDWTYESAPGLHNDNLTRLNRNATFDWVYTRGAATVVNATVGVSEFQEGFPAYKAHEYKPSDVGLPKYMDDKAGADHVLPIMTLAGYETIGLAVQNPSRWQNFMAKLEVMHIRGAHTLRGGFDARRQVRTGGGGGNTSGNFSFSNAYTRRDDDGFTPAGSLGHSWAAFMMGMPNGISIETRDTYVAETPYYAWFAQDNWRLTPKLSLTLGLRLEYELGMTERFNRAIGYFDPALDLPITAAAQAAYAARPVPELAASGFTVRGGSVYAGVGGASRRLWQNEFMLLPRVAAAYQLDSRTVLRVGAGTFYDTINPLVYGIDQYGYTQSTNTLVTTDYGVNWLAGDPTRGVSPLVDPFTVRSDGTRFDVPFGNALGAMARAGRGWNYRGFEFQHTRQHRWRFGVQRQLTANMIVDAAYVGMYADRAPLTRVMSPLPSEFWADGQVRNNAIASNLNSNMANPFYIGNFASLEKSAPVLYQQMRSLSFFTGSTIRKNLLLRPFPQMNSISNTAEADGRARYHSLELSFQRRYAKGFNVNAGYTWLKVGEADFYYNEFDTVPMWRPSNDGVPHRLYLTTVVDLPFGRGRALLSQGLPGWVLGNWQVASTYEWQPGPLLTFGNLFYYGDIENINSGTRTLDRWFNTADFERNSSKVPAAYHRRVFPTRIDGLRGDQVSFWNANLTRAFAFGEQWKLQLRLDAMNLLNRSHFSTPNVDPVSSNFGRVTAQTAAANRVLQIQVRLSF